MEVDILSGSIPSPLLSNNSEPSDQQVEFEKKEAEMLNFLIKNRDPPKDPIPSKRRTKAELLKDLPNYNSIMQLKPTIHLGQESSQLKIQFDQKEEPKRKLDFGFVRLPPPASKGKAKQMQLLMDRFIVHKTAKKPIKEESITIHITKKEEDSQGIERLVTDTENYLNTSTAEEEILPGVPAVGQGSTKEVVPGASYEKLKSSLLIQIRAKKQKRYAEKLKEHKMYAEEIDLEDKELEEEIEDECTDEEEEEDEDEIEDILQDGEEGEEADENEELGEENEEDGDSSDDEIHLVRKNKLPGFLDDEAEDTDGEDDENDDEGVPDKEDRAFIDDDGVEEEKEEDLISIASNETNDSLADELANLAKEQVVVNEPEEKIDKEVKIESALIQTDVCPNPIIERNGKRVIVPVKVTSEKWDVDCAEAFKIPVEPIELNKKSPEISKKENGISEKEIEITEKEININQVSTLKNSDKSAQYSQIEQNLNLHDQIPNSQIDGDSPLVENEVVDSQEDLFDFDPERDEAKATGPIKKRVEPPVEVQKLIEKYADEPEDVDLISLCSGRFPSQREESFVESQAVEGFEDVGNVEGMSTSTPLQSAVNVNGEEENTPTGKEKRRISVGRTKLDFGSLLSQEKSAKETPLSNELKSEELKEKKRKRILEFDSDEEDEEVLPKRKSKFADVNFEEADEANSDLSDDENEEDDEENEDEVEYDENEEIVKPKKVKKLMTKSGQLRREFYENEAELSGSEVGSEDEDEQGLDEFEEEEGDKEEIDQELLRDQVGRAHLKQVLDEDQREIRILQEQFLEDGDLHSDGKGRERQFKWKGLDDFDESAVNLADMSDPEEVELEEAEAQRMKERIEKIKWMKENSQLFDNNASDQEEESVDQLWSFTKKKKSIGPLRKRAMLNQDSSTSSSFCKKTRSFSSNTNTNFEDLQSNSEPLFKNGKGDDSRNSFSQPVFQSPEIPKIQIKGSFLSRGSPTLNRLADMAKVTDKMSNVKNNSKNFVFSVVTPPESTNENGNSKKREPARPFLKRGVEKKPVKINRSFDSLDASSKEGSVFKYY